MLLKRLFRQVRGSSFCRSCQSHQGTKIVLRELLLASDCEQTLSIGNINTLLMARQKMKDITSCGRSNIRYTRHIACSQHFMDHHFYALKEAMRRDSRVN